MEKSKRLSEDCGDIVGSLPENGNVLNVQYTFYVSVNNYNIDL